MKINDNITGDISPSATDLLSELKYLATPTAEEEHLLQVHKHEIPAILARLKCQDKIGKYIIEEPIKKEKPPKRKKYKEPKWLTYQKKVENTTRVCKICGQEKPTLDFAKANKVYFSKICKICDSKIKSKRYKKGAYTMVNTETMTKICTRCGQEKSVEEYQIDRRGKLGRKSICKECTNADKRAKRANIKACQPQPIKKDFDTENLKRYLMYQIETNKNLITKLQGKIESYQELLGEL